MRIFDEFDGYHPKATPFCMACEAMLADAVDGTLGEVDRVWFEQHIQSCVTCSERFANAQRGSAWLELLKTTRPEPGANLMARIMAETAEKAPIRIALESTPVVPMSRPFLTPFGTMHLPSAQTAANLIAFRPPAQSRGSWAVFAEPRLAMTAAMAFFSLALTMNLTGVRLSDLRASDLAPANLERSLDEAHNRAMQYYDGLKVIHVVESRVDDLKQANADREQRRTGPAEKQTKPAPQAEPKDSKKPDPGTSRREDFGKPPSTVMAEEKTSSGRFVRTGSAVPAALWPLKFAGGRG